MGPQDSDSEGQVQRRKAIRRERMGIWAWNNSLPESEKKYEVFADIPIDVWWEDHWSVKEQKYVEWICIELENHPNYITTRQTDPNKDIVFSWCPDLLDLAEGKPIIFMVHKDSYGDRLDQYLTYVFGFKETEKKKKSKSIT